MQSSATCQRKKLQERDLHIRRQDHFLVQILNLSIAYQDNEALPSESLQGQLESALWILTRAALADFLKHPTPKNLPQL